MSHRTIGAVLLAVGLGVLVATANPPVVPVAPSVAVPYYGATYAPPGGFSKDDAKRVIELLESIDGRLAALERGSGAAPVKKGPDLLAVAKARCAACHTPGKADSRGGGFILLADDAGTSVKPLSGRERARVKEAVVSGTMPPGKALSASEKAAFE